MPFSNTEATHAPLIDTSVYEPQVGARLVLEHDRHVAASVEVTAGDVDDGSPRDWPPAGHQLHDLWDLDVKHKLGSQKSRGKQTEADGKQGNPMKEWSCNGAK